eukprot:1151550-Pelagomonas_calceolata.AAC.1
MHLQVLPTYWELKELTLFLTQPNILDPSLALGLYLKIGNSNEWLYRVRALARFTFSFWGDKSAAIDRMESFLSQTSITLEVIAIVSAHMPNGCATTKTNKLIFSGRTSRTAESTCYAGLRASRASCRAGTAAVLHRAAAAAAAAAAAQHPVITSSTLVANEGEQPETSLRAYAPRVQQLAHKPHPILASTCALPFLFQAFHGMLTCSWSQWPSGEQDALYPAPGAVQIGVSVEPAAEIVNKEGSKLAARCVARFVGHGITAH